MEVKKLAVPPPGTLTQEFFKNAKKAVFSPFLVDLPFGSVKIDRFYDKYICPPSIKSKAQLSS